MIGVCRSFVSNIWTFVLRFWWKHSDKIVPLSLINPYWFKRKVTYYLIFWNHGDIMQKPTQKEPSWSLLNIPFHHLFFPFFLLCPFAGMFSWRTKTCIILFHKPFVDFQKIYNGWVFKTVIQSLFFIHLWCLNVAKHYMMPWSYCKLFFLILLSGVELFLISETEILRKSLELKVRYSRITLPSVHLCFLKLRLPCFNQGGKVTCDKLFAKNFHSMVWALSNRRSAFFS